MTEPRRRRRFKVAPATWVLAALAMGAVALVHADPWATRRATWLDAPAPSLRDRVLPQVGEGLPTDLELRIEPAQGQPIRIGPYAGAFAVWEGSTLVGPVDPVALDGLWASLTAAVRLRAADVSEKAAGIGSGGRIHLAWAGNAYQIDLGQPSPDGVGVYGVIEPGDSTIWVLEPELADIVAQGAGAWASRRPLLVELAEVTRMQFPGARIERGPDGLWRGGAGEHSALLSGAAVEARASRLLQARLDPWWPRSEAPPTGAPWLQVMTSTGAEFSVWLGGPCPEGHPGVVVDRGWGHVGCLDARLVEPWPLPGTQTPDALAWVERQFIPIPYGRVLSLEQRLPQERSLRRQGGGWVLETPTSAGGSSRSAHQVDEPQVYQWFLALAQAQVRARGDLPMPAPEVQWILHTDVGQDLAITCGPQRDGLRVCRRDDGPPVEVRVPAELALAPESFEDLDLVDLQPGEARALEIYGPAPTVRQAVHLDLGVWRLDAPVHPEGDGALDDERVESLLATIAGARLQSRRPAPAAAPQRRIRIERVPSHGRPLAVDIALYPNCVVEVDGGVSGRVSEGTCAVLRSDLLASSPLQRVLEDAQALEVERLGHWVHLVRRDRQLVRDNGDPLGDLATELRHWAIQSVRAVVHEAPSTPAIAHWRVTPLHGEPYGLELGVGWARIAGEDWLYRLGNDVGAL